MVNAAIKALCNNEDCITQVDCINWEEYGEVYKHSAYVTRCSLEGKILSNVFQNIKMKL